MDYCPDPQSILIYSIDRQYVEFPLDRIARSSPVMLPQVLKGLSSIKDFTSAQKRAICVVPALPLLVTTSPVICYAMRKIVKTNEQAPRCTAVQPWSNVASLLKYLVMSVNEGLFPFHASVNAKYIEECLESYQDKLVTIEVDVFKPALKSAQTLDEFVECSKQYTFNYLHVHEEFLYKTLIKPHCGTSISLGQVLTPHVVHNTVTAEAMRCAADFFGFKQQTFQTRFTDNLPRIEIRVQLYLDTQTLIEYWNLCKYIYDK